MYFDASLIPKLIRSFRAIRNPIGLVIVLHIFVAAVFSGCSAILVARDDFPKVAILARDGHAGTNATIRGSVKEQIFGAEYCFILQPVAARKIVIDPGLIEFTARCYSEGLGVATGCTHTIALQAAPGHNYKIDYPFWGASE